MELYEETQQSNRYFKRVMGTGPIAYWPLNEESGATVRSLVSTAQNGTYGGLVTPGAGTSPFGLPCPFFNGAGFANVLTAALIAAFSGATGSLMTWQRVSAVGDWTDGVERRVASFDADANNFTLHRKSAANNRFDWYYRSGGVQNLRGYTPFSSTAWWSMITTWTAGATHVYINGAEDLPAMVPGVWAGALANAIIGAATVVPANPWLGWISDVALWNRVLTGAEAALLG